MVDPKYGGFRKENVKILTDMDATQENIKLNELGHGVFTYYLIQAVKGKADTNKGRSEFELS